MAEERVQRRLAAILAADVVGYSRMMREYHVRFCEGLGVKFPGPTRHKR